MDIDQTTLEIADETLDAKALVVSVFNALRRLYWTHWTAHWVVKQAYDDHLLLQRLYEAISEEIDGLAEKLVAYYGEEAVGLQSGLAQILDGLEMETPDLAYCLSLEQQFLELVEDVFMFLDRTEELPLGLNDFLAAMANTHETHVYLLKRRLAV